MADLTTITQEGAFDGTVRTQINANFTALNSGDSGGSILHQATVTLTNAQIVTLSTVEVQLVAAQGAHLVIIPSAVVMQFSGDASYGDVGADAKWNFEIGDATSDQTWTSVAYFLGLTEPSIYIATGFTELTGASASAGSENAPLTIGVADSDANPDFTGGTAENTLAIGVTYLLFNTTTGLFE